MTLGLRFEQKETYEDSSRAAADFIADEIRAKRDLLICAATGGSPKRTYELLVEKSKAEPGLFDRVRILKLDEWGGMPANYTASSELYLRTHLLDPLGIPAERYFTFGNDSADPKAEAARVREMIDRIGPIDLCILGIGGNGHLAMNEPADELSPRAHVAPLTPHSMEHSMLEGLASKPNYGISTGMADILQSRKILLLVNGPSKREAMRRLLQEPVSTQFPGSFLRLHADALCLYTADTN